MKPPSKADQSYYLIFDRDLEPDVGAIVDIKAATSHKSLIVLRCDSEPQLTLPQGHQLHRYIDVFFVILATHDEQKRQSTTRDFFDWLAPTYDDVIDIEGNHENIAHLLGLLCDAIGPLPGKPHPARGKTLKISLASRHLTDFRK